MRNGLPEARERSSLARSSSSRIISAEPLRRAVSCSSTERNLCGAVMDGVAVDSASLGAPGEALFRMFFGGGQHAAAFDAELAGEHQAAGLCLRGWRNAKDRRSG